MSMEIERSDRLNGLAALSKAIDLNAQNQPLTPLGRPTTTLEMMAAQRVAVPRNVPEMMQRMKILASVAGSEYYYQFPVKSKNKETGEWEQSFIEGPSIKLANDLAREYGNCGIETVVVDCGDSWVIYARFVDLERGFTMVRPFQQRKNQKGIGTKDEARALDIALQIGVSKAIRNVIVNSLETYADFMFDEAKSGIIEKVKKQPELYRGKISTRLKELSVDVKRVEAQVGRPINDWRAEDITRVIAQIKAVGDGMATAFEIWPQSAEFVGPDETADVSDSVSTTKQSGTAPKNNVLESNSGSGAEVAKAADGGTTSAERMGASASDQSARSGMDNTAQSTQQNSEPDLPEISEALAMALSELQRLQIPEIETLLEVTAEQLSADDFEKLNAAALERKALLSQVKKSKR